MTKPKKTKRENWFVLYFVKYVLGITMMLYFKTKYYYEKRRIKVNNKIKTIKSNRRIKGRAVLIVNHIGFLDPLVLEMAFLNRILRFVVNKEVLESNKLLGWILPRLGCVEVRKGTPDASFIKRCLTILKKDQVLAIFPEGHISLNHELDQFKKGAVVFALKTKSPIIPTYIGGKYGLFKRQKLVVGLPINPYDYVKGEKYTDQEVEYINNLIHQKTNELKRIIELGKWSPRLKRCKKRKIMP